MRASWMVAALVGGLMLSWCGGGPSPRAAVRAARTLPAVAGRAAAPRVAMREAPAAPVGATLGQSVARHGTRWWTVGRVLAGAGGLVVVIYVAWMWFLVKLWDGFQ